MRKFLDFQSSSVTKIQLGVSLLATCYAANQCYDCKPNIEANEYCAVVRDDQLVSCTVGRCFTGQVWVG